MRRRGPFLVVWPFAALASGILRSLRRRRRNRATCLQRRAGTARKDGPRGLAGVRAIEGCAALSDVCARGTTHDCDSRSSLGVNQRDRNVNRMPCPTMWRRATSTNDYAQRFCGDSRSSRLRAAGARPRVGAQASPPGPGVVRSAPCGAPRRLRGLRARCSGIRSLMRARSCTTSSAFWSAHSRIQDHGRRSSDECPPCRVSAGVVSGLRGRLRTEPRRPACSCLVHDEAKLRASCDAPLPGDERL